MPTPKRTSSPNCAAHCPCSNDSHDCRLIAVTGGPGAGKTAVLELARKSLCSHVLVLPEAASIVFGGGFLRFADDVAVKAAQRAIFHVQREHERLAQGEQRYSAVLCDRGTVDGEAYWPASAQSYYAEVGTSHAAEIARYALVVHLKTPTLALGYNHDNPLRIEDAATALLMDERILAAWQDHPNRIIIESEGTFMEKAHKAIGAIFAALPACCRKDSSSG